MPKSQPRCLACAGTATRRVATVLGEPVYRCRTCSLTFCWPLPEAASDSAGAHSILTEESFTAGILSVPSERQKILDSVAERRFSLYSSALGRRQFSLLEIGCGAAGLAPQMSSLGIEYFGIDIDPRPIESARARGTQNVAARDFIEEPADQQYDVIFMTQVLEHIVHPQRMVQRISEALVSDGILHLDVPAQGTLAGLPSRLLRRKGPRFGAIDWPHHSIAYTPKALRMLLEDHFSVRTFTATSDDPVWGQGTTPSRLQRAYFAAQRTIGGKSLVVAFGQKRG